MVRNAFEVRVELGPGCCRPVGLFGWQTKTSFVRSVTAASIASRSRPAQEAGIVRGTPPSFVAAIT